VIDRCPSPLPHGGSWLGEQSQSRSWLPTVEAPGCPGTQPSPFSDALVEPNKQIGTSGLSYPCKKSRLSNSFVKKKETLRRRDAHHVTAKKKNETARTEKFNQNLGRPMTFEGPLVTTSS